MASEVDWLYIKHFWTVKEGFDGSLSLNTFEFALVEWYSSEEVGRAQIEPC